MIDALNRSIHYLRISVTDRCNLRCTYCMPEEGLPLLRHEELLTYEELLRLTKLFAELGIHKVRLTGGEPLVRQDLDLLLAGIKHTPGIRTVSITTNGLLLQSQLPALLKAGLDGVNISLDTVDEALFRQIARRDGVQTAMAAIRAAAAVPGLTVKVNCVPTHENLEGIPDMIAFTGEIGVPLRFIELMPIGEGQGLSPLTEEALRMFIEEKLGALIPMEQEEHRDKCRYFTLPGGAVIGFISAVSHKFCEFCDRIRLTAEGHLRTCLQYEDGLSLKPLLHLPDSALMQAIAEAVSKKPSGHHFGDPTQHPEQTRRMSQIGG